MRMFLPLGIQQIDGKGSWSGVDKRGLNDHICLLAVDVGHVFHDGALVSSVGAACTAFRCTIPPLCCCDIAAISSDLSDVDRGR